LKRSSTGEEVLWATVIVREGTLKEGDAIVSRAEYGRVRAMANDKGFRVIETGPSMPVEVVGFSSVPQAGMDFVCVEDDKTARAVGEHWLRKNARKNFPRLQRSLLSNCMTGLRKGPRN